MRSKKWHKSAGVVLVGLALTSAVETAAADTAPAWTRIAGYTLNAGLAGPATGPVQSVWYSADGSRLLVQLEAGPGRVFETTDFQHWKLNSQDPVPTGAPKPPTAVRPESGVPVSASGVRRYSLTQENVYVSDAGGPWVNLTGFNGKSIIGDGFSALAVSPSNPLDIAAANQYGVWRSLDGGLSWQSLNEDLPNLIARSLVGQRTISLAGGNLAAVSAGKWAPVDGMAPAALLRAALISQKGFKVTAAVQSGSVIYAGTGGGHVLISADDGVNWVDSALAGTATTETGAVNRIWLDSGNPQAALAAAGTKLYRTMSGGKFWDDVTGTLPAGVIHGISADSSAGVVYAATDLGVFSGRLSLRAADLTPTKWTPVSQDLPIAAAWDTRLNSDGTLTVLLDGYGVYETPAPHRTLAPKIVNGADMSDRAAAPGSVFSVVGANVKQARTGQNLYPVLMASDQSSQLQVPFEIAPGLLLLSIEGEGVTWTAPLDVKQAAPAIFVDADGTPIILDSASGLVIEPGTPLRGGSTIQVLATGLGRVSPEWPTGKPAPADSPPAVVAPVTAYLDGIPIRVSRATLAPTLIGNYLVEMEIPLIVNRGASELRIVVNGEESNRVKLYLESGTYTP